MTMPYASHPDDERLAAYADGEADAMQDRALSVHIASCDRCAPIVDDLSALPSLLAALPDMVPSRPLRLLPRVPEPALQPARSGIGWLRRLAGPTFAAGSALVLVGAIGASGALSIIAGEASMAGPDRSSSEELGPAAQSTKEQASPPGTAIDASAGQVPASSADNTNRDGSALDLVTSSEAPWLMVLGAGLVLVLGSALLRFAIQPRAG
jgi:anti-sigma factor RsiW